MHNALTNAPGRRCEQRRVARRRPSLVTRVRRRARLGDGSGRRSDLALEDRSRHVSGALERFLLLRGERVVRVTSGLMAGERRADRGVAAPGTDRIDAGALARRALREGVERLPVADLVRVRTRDPDVVDDRERLVRMRTARITEPALAGARPLAEQTSPSALVVEEVAQRDRPALGTAPSGQHAG